MQLFNTFIHRQRILERLLKNGKSAPLTVLNSLQTPVIDDLSQANYLAMPEQQQQSMLE